MLSSLPLELKLLLLEATTSLHTLISLSSTSRTFHSLYTTHKALLLRPFIQTLLKDPDHYPLALLLTQAESPPQVDFNVTSTSASGLQTLLSTHLQVTEFARYCFTHHTFRIYKRNLQHLHERYRGPDWPPSPEQVQEGLQSLTPRTPLETWVRAIYRYAVYGLPMRPVSASGPSPATRETREIKVMSLRLKCLIIRGRTEAYASMCSAYSVRWGAFVRVRRDGPWRVMGEFLGVGDGRWKEGELREGKWHVEDFEGSEEMRRKEAAFLGWLKSPQNAERQLEAVELWQQTQIMMDDTSESEAS